jgi:hypothetical protein
VISFAQGRINGYRVILDDAMPKGRPPLTIEPRKAGFPLADLLASWLGMKEGEETLVVIHPVDWARMVDELITRHPLRNVPYPWIRLTSGAPETWGCDRCGNRTVVGDGVGSPAPTADQIREMSDEYIEEHKNCSPPLAEIKVFLAPGGDDHDEA